MDSENPQVSFRLCNVSGFKTELLEIFSDDPKVCILLVPGNPGVVSFYKDFLVSLFELLGGNATVTAIGHISHTRKDWEHCRLFSLQQQIDHKVDFIEQELQNIKVPIVLVGHSIGSYICIETLRRSPEKVKYCIGLYPFLMLNPLSEKQARIEKIVKSSTKSALVSFGVASLGLFPRCVTRLMVSKSVGKSWSDTAIDAACSHLLQYHTFRNMLFMALTEFDKKQSLERYYEMLPEHEFRHGTSHNCLLLSLVSSHFEIPLNFSSGNLQLWEAPDWAFMRENQSKMAFLFGVNDHWGPMEMFDEIGKQVPGIALTVEREGHRHSFCCTEAGSKWVAEHVANLTKTRVLSSTR